MADHVRRSRLPAVDVSIMMPDARWLGRVATDDEARATMALEHFRQRGLSHFACYAPAIGRYSAERAHVFRRVVRAAGFECDLFVQGAQTRGWEVDHDLVVRWLSRLPRPLALFAADPYPARQMAEICDWSGIAVPDEVAILSGDNDDLLCSMSSPQLSSIQLACEKVGRNAARLLQRLIQGDPVPRQPILVPPLNVCARQSTDMFAIDDREVVAVLRYMGEYFSDGIGVSDVLRQFPISRRSLEQKFRRLLNRSPAEHLRSIRMDHAHKLVTDSDLSITEIASRAGFSSSTGLTQQFVRYFGTSPTRLRSEVRE